MQKTRETQVLSLGQEDLLEKEMATHSSIPAWRSPWMRSLAGYSPQGQKESDARTAQRALRRPHGGLNRKAVKRQGMCVYVWLIHSAVH